MERLRLLISYAWDLLNTRRRIKDFFSKRCDFVQHGKCYAQLVQLTMCGPNLTAHSDVAVRECIDD